MALDPLGPARQPLPHLSLPPVLQLHPQGAGGRSRGRRLRIYWQIFLPNSGPALAASSIFAFQWVWGDYLYPKIFLSGHNTTLAVQLVSAYADPKGNPLVTITMAAVVIYVLPLVTAFFLAQKHIIQGVVTTGFK